MVVIKTGKVNLVRKEGSMIGGSCEVEILIENINGRNYTSATVVKDTASSISKPFKTNTYRGINLEKEDDALLFFNTFGPAGIKSYEWIEPLTEIPPQGGSNITIEDVYPIGIEITTTDTTFNPMKVWGGTWTMSPAGAKRVWTRTA